MTGFRLIQPALVADIGGTYARFATIDLAASAPVLTAHRTLTVTDYRSLRDAIRDYLANTGMQQHSPQYAAFAIASAITSDQVKMTNSHWSFSIVGLRRALNLNTLTIVNDFTALAWALPTLPPSSLIRIGHGRADNKAARALIGPGTGLGVSGLLPLPNGDWIALQSEGGHALLSPVDARESAILNVAWRRFPQVSFEHLVSGTGLPILAQCIGEVDALASHVDLPDAESIVIQAQQGDPLSTATLKTFCAMLGTAAGNLALTIGARGGVYIGGGIVPRLGPLFDAALFRDRFESHGRHNGYLQQIPTWVINAKAGSPALIGVAQTLLRQRLIKAPQVPGRRTRA